MHAHEPDRTPAGHQPRRTPNPRHPGGNSPHSLLSLQATVGNAAVVRMLRQADQADQAGCPGHQGTHRPGAGRGHRQVSQPQVQRSAVHEVLRGGGHPLDGATRAEMESRLGADFSDVRVHTDSAARASATELGARAYTSGNHVVVGEGGADRHTLAHELTHVVQQRNGPVSGSDTGHGFAVSDPGDRFERAAEANARKVMSGPVPDVRRRPEAGPDLTAGPETVQRASDTTLEDAVVTYYPLNAAEVSAQDLSIKRPKTVTGPIIRTGTKGRRPASNPIAVKTLHEDCKRKISTGAPSEAQVWKDLFGGAGYDRGHVMGLELGGTETEKNIVPQWSLNQESGMWRQIEKALVSLEEGNLRFEVTYHKTKGNYRHVMVPVSIEIFCDGGRYEEWKNAPNSNDLIKAGWDPSDAAEYYTKVKKAAKHHTLTEEEMQNFTLEVLARNKADSLALVDVEEKFGQEQDSDHDPGASTADTHRQEMTRSDFPKRGRNKLISGYIKRGWVTKKGTDATVTYTLHDASVSESDSDTRSSSGSDVEMSDNSPSSPGQRFVDMQLGSQGSDSDPDYEDRMSTDS